MIAVVTLLLLVVAALFVCGALLRPEPKSLERRVKDAYYETAADVRRRREARLEELFQAALRLEDPDARLQALQELRLETNTDEIL